jgi:hypothetical protein
MKKNSYRFLIKSVPGKHSMKKDDYLTTMMQVPPKQRIPIVEFDERTQREAFTVSAEGLKGVRSPFFTPYLYFDVAALVECEYFGRGVCTSKGGQEKTGTCGFLVSLSFDV